ncbi:MCE family protein [Nocardioides sp. Bht2]|uniref:MCE family protein n=1 Tax=Nocardioides sp. Bht2 TaxID=3392297 RepID=UPI0039B5ED92
MSRASVTRSAAIKMAIFTAASLIVTGFLAAIMGNVGFGEGRMYQAIFTSATSLEKGDDVRVAGVSVGEVKKVESYQRSQAKVTFRVKADVPMTTATRAEIRFKNIVGERYLALEAGESAGEAKKLKENATIPVDRTEPSLDLNVLFNGFKPLFSALQPDEVNDLSMNIVRVMQGEGGTIRSLLENTSSLTNTLADRDELIGDVITNLSQTLDTVNDRSTELTALVIDLKGWMKDLARDRKVIGNSLDNISDLTDVIADLLKKGRPLLKDDIRELRKVATLLSRPENEAILVDLLDTLPESMEDQARTGTMGSWYAYYLCSVGLSIKLPVLSDIPVLNELQKALSKVSLKSTAKRCK